MQAGGRGEPGLLQEVLPAPPTTRRGFTPDKTLALCAEVCIGVSCRAFRVLTVIDQWSRESVLLEADVALTGHSVADALETLSARRPLPKPITVGHGTEFTSKALDEWAYRRESPST